MKTIYCKRCLTVLTKALVPLKDTSLLKEEDGEAHVPAGYYLISDGEYLTNSEGKILVNLGDIVNTKLHSDTRRVSGCCGLSGLDGPKRLCINGHEVGTEMWIVGCRT